MTSPQFQPGQTPTQKESPHGGDRAQTPQTAPTTGDAQQAPDAPEGREKPAGGKVVHMHTAHPRVPIPYVTPGDMFTGARRGTSMLPSPRKMIYYGALGAMAVAGALEWPVAVAVGAATEVITREQGARKRAGREEEQRRQPDAEPSARTESAQPRQTATA